MKKITNFYLHSKLSYDLNFTTNNIMEENMLLCIYQKK